MSEIKITIKENEYTIEEAKELYLELRQLFKEKEYSPWVPQPYPTDPYPHHILLQHQIEWS